MTRPVENFLTKFPHPAAALKTTKREIQEWPLKPGEPLV